MADALDADLLAHIRLLIEDVATPTAVTDAQVYNIAKGRRKLLYFEPLYSDDYLTWYSPANFIQVILLSNTYEGAAITPQTSDTIEGRWVFTVKQGAVYLHGYSYDLNDIVANLWLVKAGLADAFKYSLGDENVDPSVVKEKCIQMYWKYCQSQGGRLCR